MRESHGEERQVERPEREKKREKGRYHEEREEDDGYSYKLVCLHLITRYKYAEIRGTWARRESHPCCLLVPIEAIL